MSDNRTLSRRTFVAGIAVTALAGCLGDDDEIEWIEAPDATFEIEGDSSGITITQTEGDTFDGSLAELQGEATYPASPDTLADAGPDEWSPTTSVEIHAFNIRSGTLQIVWVGDEDGETVLAEAELE